MPAADKAADDAASVSESAKLPLSVKVAFGLPQLPGIGMALPIGIFMTKFYSDTVGVALGFIALAQTVARSIDAITDPFMGWLSDRTRTRWGRRKPWMIVGAPLAAIVLVALFAPPEDLDPLAGAAWFAGAFVLYYIFHTIYTVPHVGLGPELTFDYHERSSLFAWKDVMMFAGVATASAVPGVVVAWLKGSGVDPGDAQRITFFWFAVAMAALLVLSYLWLCYHVPERRVYTSERGNPLIPGVRRALRNRPFRLLLVCFVVAGVSSQMFGLLMPFYLQYAVGITDWVEWTGVLMLTSYGVGAATIPLWLRFSRRVGKVPAWIAASTSAVASDIGLFLLPSFVWAEDAIPWLFVMLFLRAGSVGGTQFLAPATQADAIDYDELHTGERREGQYAALWSIATKFATIPTLAIPLTVLAALGFEPNVEQSDAVQWAIRIIYGLVPAVLVLVAIYALWRFPITEARHRETLAALARHRRGEAAVDPLTGKLLEAPSNRGLDVALGWFLDHFSPGELRRAQKRGASSVARLRLETVRALGASSVILVLSCMGAWWTVADLSTRPGLVTICLVLVAGFSLTAIVFHAIRHRAARSVGTLSVQDITRHLEITRQLEQRG